MSFSLKYLFALVALAAIFSAALLYRTPLWVVAAINVSVIVLLAGTLGVWLRRLDRTFWIPFCVVGWSYLALSLTRNGFAQFLPAKHISYSLKRTEVEPILKKHRLSFLERLEGDLYHDNLTMRGNRRGPGGTDGEMLADFRRFVDIVDALSALIAGGLAGVITSVLIRPKREA